MFISENTITRLSVDVNDHQSLCHDLMQFNVDWRENEMNRHAIPIS